jgi:hypothetical protein
MSVRRLLSVGVAVQLLLAVTGPQALAAIELPISRAAEKSALFADHTCAHDKHCVGHGVSNCHRQRPRIVFCRIVLRRSTPTQGRYRCTRLVRLGMDPKTHRVPVTGLGHWQCGDQAAPGTPT